VRLKSQKIILTIVYKMNSNIRNLALTSEEEERINNKTSAFLAHALYMLEDFESSRDKYCNTCDKCNCVSSEHAEILKAKQILKYYGYDVSSFRRAPFKSSKQILKQGLNELHEIDSFHGLCDNKSTDDILSDILENEEIQHAFNILEANNINE
jgi:hypothetical protein